MKIVILDPYFETLGGGEKVLSVMASHLSLKNNVTVLVKKPVNKKLVSDYFDVDLDKVKFKLIPEKSFFVKLLSSPHIKFPGRWRSLIFDLGSLKALKKMDIDLFINNLYQSSLPSPAPKSIYMCMFPQKLTPSAKVHTSVRSFYNKITDVLENLTLGNRKKAIDSYTIVTANSNYTAGWIKRYWSRDVEVLYPVCDDMGPPDTKKNIILSVGRFFADTGSSHHKRHDELIKAFIRLDRPDWELHLAGSLAADSDSQAYFAGLNELAKGHSNIFIHPDMPFADLKKIRRQSAIYWHATGYGYDPDIYPENQEHFGMVTVEAMSAGAVPIVYKCAGQIEVVSDGVNGFLWETIDELLERTSQVMSDKALRNKIAHESIKRASDFDRQAFLNRVDTIFSQLV